MTERTEIERLLNQTGRTLEGLPDCYTRWECAEAFRRLDCKSSADAHIKGGNMILHQSDVIELLIGALRDALTERDAALAKVPRWISVEERLPPPETEIYLATCVLPNGDCTAHMVVWAWDENDEQGDWICQDVVTHWMQWPELPKEEEK